MQLSRILVTHITDHINYPPMLKGKLTVAHNNCIANLAKSYSGTKKEQNSIVDALNKITYLYMSGDSLPPEWSEKSPELNLPDVDDDTLKQTIGKLFINIKSLVWDLPTKELPKGQTINPDLSKGHTKFNKPNHVDGAFTPVQDIKTASFSKQSDISIQSPIVPRFDCNKVFASGKVDNIDYVIYTTLPEIPEVQNQISITTDITKMTPKELLHLFPTHTLRTRPPIFYQKYEGLEYVDGLGVVLPIAGYTHDQLVENLIKYPHLYKLYRRIDDRMISFANFIEINGELIRTPEVWNDLIESSKIPLRKPFIREYVIRRYLLERDHNRVQHRYELYGQLDPFLTLFTTPEQYDQWGYNNPLELAKACVNARVSYKRSVSPVLRRLSDAGLYI